MAKRKFHMKQTNLHGHDWRGLSFLSYMREVNAPLCLSDPVISSVCGDEVDYGALLAYCFRRFGYPERGWDDYKELVTYYLTTPHSDMVLNITPYVGNTSSITFEFLVKRQACVEIESYARRDRLAWEQRQFNWAEKQGLPDWMPEWMDIYNDEYRAAFPNIPHADNWRQVINFTFPIGDEGSRPYELTSRVSKFREKLHKDYSEIEPWPDYYMRPACVQELNDDDPLKPFAQAAIIALEDLSTSVGVRDQAINAFGSVDSSRVGVKVSPSAGYPSGSLGNAAAKEFADLHGLILKLGNGDAKRGIKKALLAITPNAAQVE